MDRFRLICLFVSLGSSLLSPPTTTAQEGGGGGGRGRGDPNSIEYFTNHAYPLPDDEDDGDGGYDDDDQHPDPVIAAAVDDAEDSSLSYSYPRFYAGSNPSPCHESSCYPATGDLLLGREAQFHASSTCGLGGPQRYCVISHLDETEKCFTCDSRNPYGPRNHILNNVITSYNYPSTSSSSNPVVNGVGSKRRHNTWWQAESGVENVSIRLDLEAEFHFTHLIMTFKTFRPAGMIIEKSSDHGLTWRIYRYFAYDCHTTFPGIPTGPQTSITDVVCESRYSEVAPSTRGEVIFRVLSPNIEIEDPYASDVQDLLKLTNLRINFTHLHNLGDNLLDPSEGIQEKYYYAIYDMVVRGSCSCYGHASRCIPLEDQGIHRRDMVYGKCECQHNTKGLNCEQCEDFYNDLPWMPAIGSVTNACKRCECHGHADRCHYDPFKYLASGNRTGGVCDGCLRHTMGANCEQCRPGYYQDPGRQLSDPLICEKCDCSEIGSQNNGECQSHTDEENGMVAGRCICKKNVGGTRCDKCKPGFWNLDPSNPDGCEPCQCNTLGTVGNMGCVQTTGVCICKKNVFGRKCDRCYPGYFGLSDREEGCQPCNCNPGSAFDNNCDTAIGQCRCRPNMDGRQCDKPSPGHYCVMMDHYLYEAEHSVGRVKFVQRPLRLGENQTWTGDLVEVGTGQNLSFAINNIAKTMDYQLVVRFDSSHSTNFKNVTITLNRPFNVNPNGRCRSVSKSQDEKRVNLFSTEDYFVVDTPFCLERGVNYYLTLEFNGAKLTETKASTMLIDSLMLVPTVESVNIFKGSDFAEKMRSEYTEHKCREYAFSVKKGDIPEPCKKYICSVGIEIINPPPCSCDITGSVSTICQELGGKCQCKNNVVGRRCDRCAPGFYGFSPQGCQPCNCDRLGSTSNLCNERTGQCPCVTNIAGSLCDQCSPGYYGFPNCKPCECNGHASTCDAITGECIDCSGSTSGWKCEECKKGFYGDPKIGSSIPCRQCQCPGSTETGQYFASECSLVMSNTIKAQYDVACECDEGYEGLHCQRCSKNYFGNPQAPGGRCEKCSCSGNIDHSVPHSCDPTTGQCRKCLYKTKGFYCEQCEDGFYGNATMKDCQECRCDMLGTFPSAMNQCDGTGQCACLPNVVGLKCDKCARNHWKIASGRGCDSCGCSAVGAEGPTCNEFTGQCKCKPTYGGRTCSECQDNHWGDPNANTCEPCNCNLNGSEGRQCDRKTGKCKCRRGITGYKCDQCDRGTIGDLTRCKPCGTCFENWDKDITELQSHTNLLVEQTKEARENALSNVYDEDQNYLSDKLQEISNVASQSFQIESDMDQLKEAVGYQRKFMRDSNKAMDGTIETDITAFDQVQTVSNKIAKMIAKVEQSVYSLSRRVNRVTDQDMTSTLEELQQLRNDSDASAQRVKLYAQLLKQNKEEFKDLNVSDSVDSITKQFHNNTVELVSTEDFVQMLETSLEEFNVKLCGNASGCSHCDLSGLGSKCPGFVGKSLEMKNMTESALAMENDLKQIANVHLNTTSQLLQVAEEALIRTISAHNVSESLKRDITEVLNSSNEFLKDVGEFFDARQSTPEKVQKFTQTLLNISMTNLNISELSVEITDLLDSTNNVELILESTKANLSSANELLNRTKSVTMEALEVESMLRNAMNRSSVVLDQFEATSAAVNRSEEVSSMSEGKIRKLKQKLDSSDVTRGITKMHVERFDERTKELKEKVGKVNKDIDLLDAATEIAEEKSASIQLDAEQQTMNLRNAAESLSNKTATRSLVKEMKVRATNLYKRTAENFEKLAQMEMVMNEYDDELVSLFQKIESLRTKLETTAAKEEGMAAQEVFHRRCIN